MARPEQTQSADLRLPTLVACCVTLSAILVSSFFLEARLWGISWYGYYGWPGRLAFAVIATAALWLTLISIPASGGSSKRRARSRYPVLAAGLVAAFSGVLWILRGDTHFLGDGYQLLSWLEQGLHFKPWEQGTFAVQGWVFEFLGGRGTADARLALQVVSVGAGSMLLGATAFVATKLFEAGTRRLMFVVGIASGGYMLLYFGYLESYPLFVFTVVLFCLVGLLAARDQINRWWILLPLALAASFHIFSVTLIPAALFILVQGTRPGQWLATRGRVTKILMSTGVAAAAVVTFYRFYTTSYFFQFTIVPFVTNRFTTDGYTMFSGKHLLDYVNHLFQLVPFGLLVLPLLIARWRKWGHDKSDYWFLLLAALGPLGLTFMINPGLGMPRDWDLFSFAGVPLAVACYYALLDERHRIERSTSVAVLAIAVGLLSLFPRAVIQADPDKAIALYDNIRMLDPLRNSGGEFWMNQYLISHGRRQEAAQRQRLNTGHAQHENWDRQGQQLMRQHKYPQAIEKFEQVVTRVPIYSNAWTNMGLCYLQIGQTDSSLQCFQIADAMNPYNFNNYNGLARTYFTREEYVPAEEYWLKSIELNPAQDESYRYLLIMGDLGETDVEPEYLYAKMATVGGQPGTPLRLVSRSARLLLERKEIGRARTLFRRALQLGLDSNQVRDLQVRYPDLKVIDQPN